MRHRKYVFLYLAIVCFYTLTGSGRIGGSDALSMFRVEINIVDHGSVRAEPCNASNPNPQCVPGVDGRYYSSYGILSSLSAAPAYAVAKVITRFLRMPTSVVGGFLTMQVTGLVAAAVPVAMVWWVELMGYSWGGGCFAALALAFGTPFWFHGVKEFYSEPYMALPLILSAIAMLNGTNRRWFAAAGLLLGIACSARIIAVLVLPLYVGVLLWRRWRSSGVWGDAVSFIVPTGIVLLLIGEYNFTRFGSFTKTGYHWLYPSIAASLSVPVWKGLWSYMFEPDNSLLYFAPLAALAPWGVVLLYKRRRLDAIVCAGTFLSYMLFFAKFVEGDSPWAYGPRLLVPGMPFLFLPLSALWDRINQSTRRLRWPVLALLTASIVIHVVGAIYPLPLYYLRQGWVSARTGSTEYPGYIRSMFTELPQVVRGMPRGQQGREIGDPLIERTLRMETYPTFESLVESFPNPINVTGADLWLVKFAVLLHAPWLCGALAVLLAGAGCWFLAKGLAGASP